jgi:2-polyprenyl-3-methyl-5-hydroxy-6-metoxy-1,4-benzoquinol methylase
VKRAPEEELMDLPHHAEAYAQADFSEPNSMFVDLFSEKFPAFKRKRILDLGCGPADIAIRLAERYLQATVTGVDGAGSMLEIAKKAILRQTSLTNRVEVRKWHIGAQENPLGAQRFHAIVSNSLLHHMRDPLDLWRAIYATAAPGATVLVMDLIRPQSVVDAEQIVEKYTGNEPQVLRSDFLNSLLAAYRPAEVRQQLALACMDFLQAEIVSDRHLIVFGAMR